MKQVIPQDRLVLSKGPASGRITGINHIVLFTSNMNEAVHFYRDILGLKVVRTQPRFSTSPESVQSTALHSSRASQVRDDSVELTIRQYFFEICPGSLFSLYETTEMDKHPDASIVSFLWPLTSSENKAPIRPQKMDHLAFNVEERTDLEWFHAHLQSHGVPVSDVIDRTGKDNQHRFISSIFFSDPSGNMLEIATFNFSDPSWSTYDFRDWFRDEDPVPALIGELERDE